MNEVRTTESKIITEMFAHLSFEKYGSRILTGAIFDNRYKQ
jgi:hypothetical protein